MFLLVEVSITGDSLLETHVFLIGAAELPGTNLTLQYVALGLGTQNYFCPVLDSPPVQVGASATLFDVTTLAYDNQTALNSLPPLVVHSLLLPSRLRLNAPFRAIILGYHFFDSAGTPVFDLFSANKILYGTKIAEIEAPETANKGPSGTGAVNWLLLGSKAGSKSSGCSLVYIVVTAGGRPPLHYAHLGTLIIHYAAEFWFFD
jgi:hypothetical protein